MILLQSDLNLPKDYNKLPKFKMRNSVHNDDLYIIYPIATETMLHSSNLFNVYYILIVESQMTTQKKFVVLKDGFEKQKATFKGYVPTLEEALKEIRISLCNLVEHTDLKSHVHYKSTKEMADLITQHKLYRQEQDGIVHKPNMCFEFQCANDIAPLLRCLSKMSKSAVKYGHSHAMDFNDLTDVRGF